MLPRILVALALIAAPALAQAQSQGTPSFKSLTLGGGITCAAGPTCDVSGLSVTPNASAAPGIIGRSIFEALRGSTFYLRPFLTDLTCATDQTANINAAILTAPAGAQIVAPPGCILTTGNVTITSKWLRGSGRSAAATEWRYTAASGPAIKVMGDGARVSDLLLTNPGVSNSTAVAIQLADGVQNPRGQMVDHVRAVGFQDQLDIQSGEFWSATNLDFYNATRYGARIRNGYNVDSGDGVIANSAIYADNPIGVSGIRLESGGGLKVSTTKILQFATGADFAMADGAVTSDVFLDDTVSIEGQYNTGVSLGRISGGTTGSLINIKVNAQIAGPPTGIAIHDGVGNVSLAPIITSVSYGTVIDGGYNIALADGTPMQNVGVSAVTLQGTPSNVRIGRLNCTNCVAINQDQRATTAAGPIDRSDMRPLTLAGGATASLYSLAIPAYHGARVVVQVEGVLNNVGVVNSLRDSLATNGGSAVAMTSLNSTDAGTPMTVTFDTATTAGTVLVKVTNPNATAANNFIGSVSVRIDGKSSAFAIQ